jgi:RNA polymerase sigma factor (sigma-70 family)
MKITEENFKDWFPANNRFLHFCAKYYGMSFHNDEVVEEAAFQAAKNVMRLWKRGEEFESEQHMMGTVMSCFRFGILNAYQTIERRGRVPTRSESELTYGSADDEFNIYLSKLISHDKEYNNLNELINKSLDQDLNQVEADIIRLVFYEDLKRKDVCDALDICTREYRKRFNSALTKLKKAVKNDEPKEQTNLKPYPKFTYRKVPKVVRSEPVKTHEDKERNYRKAMSYLYS